MLQGIVHLTSPSPQHLNNSPSRQITPYPHAAPQSSLTYLPCHHTTSSPHSLPCHFSYPTTSLPQHISTSPHHCHITSSLSHHFPVCLLPPPHPYPNTSLPHLTTTPSPQPRPITTP
ncbi:hypothetical protein Pcinc_043549 [Petrolisthes cinctipes]|uniref:Uncharacterized protein n=1 Tax=Petrolisthes cinctipes TaxID=88211 RepID=A0AAE1EG01_PETCI|nr:hypothetical protein Pcinc_043549 [Petrolisthes cinctipes]